MRSPLLRRLAATALALALALPALLSTAPPATADGASPVALGAVPLSPGLAADLASLPPETPYAAFAHFAGGAPSSWVGLLEDRGLEIVDVFEKFDAAFVAGTLADFRALSHLSGTLTYLEKNERIEMLGDTASWATGVAIARQPVAGGAYRDRSGRVLDGTGVGVAIIDSGVDGDHPDLINRIGRNFKVVCSLVLEYTDTGRCFPEPIELGPGEPSDTTSGHGTHVAGIVAGDGTASKGTFTGAAPGATLFTYGVGDGDRVLFAVQAYEHIVDNLATFNPPIRMVSNSWGNAAGTPYNPNGITEKAVEAASDAGLISLFAAGNSGSDRDTGNADDLSSTAKIPTPGVITLANYDDDDLGAKNFTLSTSSSRGKKGTPATYPDLSAPGSSITSTCDPRLAFCNLGPSAEWSGDYAVLSGTSMATPHTAGAVALLLQARPELTPAQVEDLLQDTALKFTGCTPAQTAATCGAPGLYEPDPQNPGGTVSYDKGAGLLDVPAALNALGVDHDGAPVVVSPRVSVVTPAEGSEHEGLVAVTGSAFDAVPPRLDPPAITLAAGDGGDFQGPGAADLVGLTVDEQETGFLYTWQVRSLTDLPPTGSVSLRVTQVVDGKSFLSTVILNAVGATPAAASTGNTAVPTSASRNLATNTVSAFVPFTNLGNAPGGSVAYKVFASSFIGAIVDSAPGGRGADAITRPEYSRPYTVVRPRVVVPPTATVTIALDGGAEVPAALTGTSPEYDWAGSVDLTGATPGTHTITATLRLDGVVRATDSVTVVVPEPITYAVTISDPGDGTNVPRGLTELRGTAGPSRPVAAAQSVTVQVTGGGFDSGELAAGGVAGWSRSFDFGAVPAGAATIVARYYAGGTVVATATSAVNVPAVVSYAGQGAGFWKKQLAGGGVFTAAEVSALATRAVQLSGGWFADRAAIEAALSKSPKDGLAINASRQYAALVLNLAGGELSGAMGVAVGFSGDERLDPSIYNTAVVGSTVDAAAAWIRAQLPDGDTDGALAVGTAVNTNVGLI